ncbi:unnamed protein product [Alternaria alternata]
MQALRSAPRAASQFRSTGLPRLLRGYATQRSFEHLLVSEAKPGYLTHAPKSKSTAPRPSMPSPPHSSSRSTKPSATSNPKSPSRAIVLTGSEKAFAAGADIKEMKDLTFSDAYGKRLSRILAAELAMMGDIMYAGPKAVFGQPEIKLGVIPGAGGSQRLTKAIGKSRAMEAILTGDNITAQQASEWGLVSKVFETPEECVNGAIATAEKIAGYSQIAVKAAKEVVNKSQELGIREGVEYERRVFHGLFGSEDQKIGMTAFAAKEKANWANK